MRQARSRQTDRKVLLALYYHLSKHEYSPTLRELVELAEVSSTSVVHDALERLAMDGYVRREVNMARTVRLTDAGRRMALYYKEHQREHSGVTQ